MTLKSEVTLSEEGPLELSFEASTEVCQREQQEKSHPRVCIV